MLDTVQKKPLFSFDEHEAMLSLRSGVDQSLGDTTAGGSSDYRLRLLDLETFTMSDDA